jgi:ketosteroid isomerase-like protein
MSRRVCLFLILAVAVSLTAIAQEHHAAAPAAESTFDKAIMQKVWDAWCTLDVKNPAKFYSHEPNHPFYDIAPLKYGSWSEYESGVKNVIGDWKSAKAKVNYDGMVRQESPTMAWTASTVDLEYVDKDGKTQKATLRWTAIWHKHGADWMIAHDHTSAPMP